MVNRAKWRLIGCNKRLIDELLEEKLARRRRRHPIDLTDEEKAFVENVINDRSICQQSRTRARVLLLLNKQERSQQVDNEVAEVAGITGTTLQVVVQRFQETGVIAAVMGKKKGPQATEKVKVRLTKVERESITKALGRNNPAEKDLNREEWGFGIARPVGRATTNARILLIIDEGEHNRERAPTDGEVLREFHVTAATLDGIRRRFGENGIVAAMNPEKDRHTGLGQRKYRIQLTLAERQQLESKLESAGKGSDDDAQSRRRDKSRTFARALLELDEGEHGPDHKRTRNEVMQMAKISTAMLTQLMRLYTEGGVERALAEASQAKRIGPHR